MGKVPADAHPRGAAVAQRLRSALLAGFCLCIRMGDRKQTDVAQSQPRLIFR
jgi:hypothetical protein